MVFTTQTLAIAFAIAGFIAVMPDRYQFLAIALVVIGGFILVWSSRGHPPEVTPKQVSENRRCQVQESLSLLACERQEICTSLGAVDELLEEQPHQLFREAITLLSLQLQTIDLLAEKYNHLLTSLGPEGNVAPQQIDAQIAEIYEIELWKDFQLRKLGALTMFLSPVGV